MKSKDPLILKIQGLASEQVLFDAFPKIEFDKKRNLCLFLSGSDFLVENQAELRFYDLLHNKEIGKLKLSAVSLLDNILTDRIPSGHRTVSLFEILDGARDEMIEGMTVFERFEVVKDRFFLFRGDFQTLYGNYFGETQ